MREAGCLGFRYSSFPVCFGVPFTGKGLDNERRLKTILRESLTKVPMITDRSQAAVWTDVVGDRTAGEVFETAIDEAGEEVAREPGEAIWGGQLTERITNILAGGVEQSRQVVGKNYGQSFCGGQFGHLTEIGLDPGIANARINRLLESRSKRQQRGCASNIQTKLPETLAEIGGASRQGKLREQPEGMTKPWVGRRSRERILRSSACRARDLCC